MSRSQPIWSKKDADKIEAIARKSRDATEALKTIAAVFPDRTTTGSAIKCLLSRLGRKSLTELAKEGRGAKDDSDRSLELSRFATIAKQGLSFEDLCDRADLAPKRAKALLEACKKAGYRIETKGGMVGYVPSEPLKSERKLVAQPGDREVFAVISDLHFGSKYCLEDRLVDFVERAHREDGVTQFFLAGDNLDGVYRHSRWEESHHGFAEQAKRMAQVLPRIKGVRYDGIIGNHDETFERENGMDVCQATEDVFRRAGRTDLRLHAARGAYLRFAPKGGRGVLVELWHPLGGGAYAVSYKLQRHVEEYGVGQKPDFLFAGHWHQQCYVVRRGVHAFSSGTFHGGGSSFGKALGGAQAIGGWVVRFAQTKDGTLRDVTPTWRAYYETEKVRSLGLT